MELHSTVLVCLNEFAHLIMHDKDDAVTPRLIKAHASAFMRRSFNIIEKGLLRGRHRKLPFETLRFFSYLVLTDPKFPLDTDL